MLSIEQALKQVEQQAKSLTQKPVDRVAQKAKMKAHNEEYKNKMNAFYQTDEGQKALEESEKSWEAYGKLRQQKDPSVVSGSWVGD